MFLSRITRTSFSRARYHSAKAALLLLLAAAVLGPIRAFGAPAPQGPSSDRLEPARQLLRSKHPAAKDRILAQAEAEADPATRAGLIGLLVNLKPGAVSADELRPYLDDSDAGVRAEAVRSLGAHGGAGAREALEDLLLNDGNVGVRLAAAFWLGGLKSPDSATALGQALAQDKDPNVRIQAARSLQWLGTGAARTQLRQGSSDADARVRRIANE